MPPINFSDDVSLAETLKNNIRTIYTFPHAYGHDRFLYFYYLLQNPTEFIDKYLRVLEECIRHQGRIWPQTYYWLIFIVELLTRDFNILGNDNLPLEYQIYLENYVINPLLGFYSDNHYCSFVCHDFYDEDDNSYYEHKITKKMVFIITAVFIGLRPLPA